MVSAEGGSAFFGNVGIGTDNNSNALTVVGNISAVGTHTFEVSSITSPVTIRQTGWVDLFDNAGNILEVIGGYGNNPSVTFAVTNKNSIREGYSTTASGNWSHAEGSNTIASGRNSHSEGYATRASGESSHAEGSNTTASGSPSHAEGVNTIASGHGSHAEGTFTRAAGDNSHSEGYGTRAIGGYSHAGGMFGVAAHNNSWIWRGLTTPSLLGVPEISSARSGQFMVSAEGGSAFFGNVGIGTDDKSNALTVVGNISATGMLQLSLTSTPPSNTSTPAAWEDIQVGGVTYKIPLYL